jgi:hypothetical protein
MVISRGLELKESGDDMSVNYAKQYRLGKKSLFREILSVQSEFYTTKYRIVGEKVQW